MSKLFGYAPDGDAVERHILENGGVSVAVLSWGATLQEFRIKGSAHSLVLGGRDMAAYLGPMRYFGAIVGPVANRIANGRFEIAEERIDLDKNEAGCTTLHSGIAGFSDRNWRFIRQTETECVLALAHPDGLGGFPGNIAAVVIYRLEDDGALTIEITGTADRTTYFSPAFHGYWNLSGGPDLAGHRLTVNATQYLPVDGLQIPRGQPLAVNKTGYDYRKPRPIGQQLDHNFCLPDAMGAMQHACTLQTDDVILEVSTDQPGVQVYNGQHVDTGLHSGLEGRPYGPCSGLAIEPQFWPDTPNRPDFPSSLLRPAHPSRHRSRFWVRNRR